MDTQNSSPLDTIRIAFLGVGARGTFLMDTMLTFPDVRVMAVYDIDPNAVTRAQELAERKSGVRPTGYCRDDLQWREVIARDDIDAVVIASPWEWHATMAIESMRAGKYVGVEVPACLTLEECRDLVRTSEETGVPCMMLENVNYFRNALSTVRMVREGVLGDITHAEVGYQHDCRFLAFTEDGRLTWRGRNMARLNGNLYPTHPIGPVAWWMNINRGDRFVRLSSLSSPSRSLKQYAAKKFGPDHPLALREYAQGDVNTTLIETASGATVTLYFDLCTPRPYDLILRIQGSKGIYEGGNGRIHLDGISLADEWEDFEKVYADRFDHPLWTKYAPDALKNGGHGGCDYIVTREFLDAVKYRTQTPQDVYDAATWSSIIPLSIRSVANHGESVEFPDFTGGRWETNRPVM